MVFPGKADRDACREQQSEVGKNRVARGRDKGNVEHVGLPQSKQQCGNGKHRDGQHQRPPERLQALYAEH